MKSRVMLTLDPDIVKKAKRVAHTRQTSVSALVEDLVRRTPVSSRGHAQGFVGKWSGRFRVRTSAKPDARLAYLRKHYGLGDK